MALTLVEEAKQQHPDLFARIRAACQFGAVDLDVHAARIARQIVERRRAASGCPCWKTAEYCDECQALAEGRDV